MKIHRTVDSTFVIEKNGYPYHVAELPSGGETTTE